MSVQSTLAICTAHKQQRNLCSDAGSLHRTMKLTGLRFLLKPLQPLCNSSILLWQPLIFGARPVSGFHWAFLRTHRLVLLGLKSCYTPVTREKTSITWSRHLKHELWRHLLQAPLQTCYLGKDDIGQNMENSFIPAPDFARMDLGLGKQRSSQGLRKTIPLTEALI